MTKGITNRVKMQELADVLHTLPFEEITQENIQKGLPNAEIQFVNRVRPDTVDIALDDYIFTAINKTTNIPYPSEWLRIRQETDKPYFLSDNVVVYIPLHEDDTYTEIEGEGYIEDHDGNLVLKVTFEVE